MLRVSVTIKRKVRPSTVEPEVKETPKAVAVETVDEVTNDHGPMKLVKEFSVIDHGKDFHKVMQAELGLSPEFIRSSSERVLRINIDTGMPELDPQTKHKYREVVLVQPIVLYSVFETEDGKARFICIGCTNKTAYMIVKKDLAYSFIIDMSSLVTTEAVKNLYISNLNKGPVVYRRSASLLNNFFERLFAATFNELTVLSFDTKHLSGDNLPMKLYLDPQKPTNNMLSVCGWVYDVDINDFPGRQINRAYNIKKKEAAEVS